MFALIFMATFMLWATWVTIKPDKVIVEPYKDYIQVRRTTTKRTRPSTKNPFMWTPSTKFRRRTAKKTSPTTTHPMCGTTEPATCPHGRKRTRTTKAANRHVTTTIVPMLDPRHRPGPGPALDPNHYPGSGPGAIPLEPGQNQHPGSGPGAIPPEPDPNQHPGSGPGAIPPEPHPNQHPASGPGAPPPENHQNHQETLLRRDFYKRENLFKPKKRRKTSKRRNTTTKRNASKVSSVKINRKIKNEGNAEVKIKRMTNVFKSRPIITRKPMNDTKRELIDRKIRVTLTRKRYSKKSIMKSVTQENKDSHLIFLSNIKATRKPNPAILRFLEKSTKHQKIKQTIKLIDKDMHKNAIKITNSSALANSKGFIKESKKVMNSHAMKEKLHDSEKTTLRRDYDNDMTRRIYRSTFF